MISKRFSEFLRSRDLFRYLLFFVLGISALLIMSSCSPLYKFSTAVDTNVFRASAKNMLDGKILYKDFFEVKGPYIYFLYMLSILMFPNSYFGIFIFECIAAFFFYKYSYKMLKVVFTELSDRIITISTCLGCTCFYLSGFIAQGGEIEEFVLCFQTYVMYLLVRVVKNNEKLKFWECFAVGIHFALIFWSKYLVLAPYVGCFIILLIYHIKQKDMKNFGLIILKVLSGFCTVSFVTIIYCLLSGNLFDMLNIYFYENIFVYSKIYVDKSGVLPILISNVIYNWLPFVAGLTASVIIIVHHKIDFTHLSIYICFVVSTVILFATKCAWCYYYTPLSVYNSYFVCAMFMAVKDIDSNKFFYILTPILLIIQFMAGLITSSFFTRNELAKNITYVADNIIQDKSFIFLNSMDCGLYFLTDYYPDDYYIMKVNSRLPDIIQAYSDHISNNDIDCMVLKSYDRDYLKEHNVNAQEIEKARKELEYWQSELSENNYELIADVSILEGFDFLIYEKGILLANGS